MTCHLVWLITRFTTLVIRRVPLEEQEYPTHWEQLSKPQIVVGSLCSIFSVSCSIIMTIIFSFLFLLTIALFVLFFLAISCLPFFDLWILITPFGVFVNKCVLKLSSICTVIQNGGKYTHLINIRSFYGYFLSSIFYIIWYEKARFLTIYGSTMTKKRRKCFLIIWGVNFRYSNCIANYINIHDRSHRKYMNCVDPYN